MVGCDVYVFVCNVFGVVDELMVVGVLDSELLGELCIGVLLFLFEFVLEWLIDWLCDVFLCFMLCVMVGWLFVLV